MDTNHPEFFRRLEKCSDLNLKLAKINNSDASEEGWFILTNLDNLDSAIKAYKQSFDVEEMFRDFKSGGYNLEDTNVSGQRLISVSNTSKERGL